MDLQKLTSYIKQQIDLGVSSEIVTASLIKAGWQAETVKQAYENLKSHTTTEADYPIQFKWVFKNLAGLLSVLIFSIVLLMIGYYNLYAVYVALWSPIQLIILILRRSNFHYAVEDKFLTLKQGILSKQERHIPYGVIQNVFVKQDLFDRLFGMASLTLENAAQGAGAMNANTQKVFGLPIVTSRGEKEVEMLGFNGNRVSIPGLNKDDAEKLKTIVLMKMKENPIVNTQSGL